MNYLQINFPALKEYIQGNIQDMASAIKQDVVFIKNYCTAKERTTEQTEQVKLVALRIIAELAVVVVGFFALKLIIATIPVGTLAKIIFRVSLFAAALDIFTIVNKVEDYFENNQKKVAAMTGGLFYKLGILLSENKSPLKKELLNKTTLLLGSRLWSIVFAQIANRAEAAEKAAKKEQAELPQQNDAEKAAVEK